ncbi:MAG: SGNH/GDSL hydrolase family protein [Acidobacteriaceae bacterium]
MTPHPRLSRLLLLFAFTAIAATSYAAPPPDHWVGTWAAAPFAANNGRPAAATLVPVASATAAPAQTMAPASAPTPVPAPARPPAFVYGTADTTVREIVHVSLGGPQVRVVFTNEFGTEPLTIDAAHVAVSQGGSTINLVSAAGLTFGGRTSVVVPPGALVVSDPATLKLPAAADLAISFFLPAQTITHLSQHGNANQTSYAAPGNVAGAKIFDNPTRLTSWAFVKGVDVKVSADSAAVVALGDSITDGAFSSLDANARWPDELARRLLANKKTANLAVLNEGIGGNRILNDVTGPSALARFDRDVLAQSGVKYLIILESINDIGHATDPVRPNGIVSADDLIFGLTQLAERAHTHGIKVYAATLTPDGQSKYDSPAAEAMREAVNQWIRTTNQFDGFIDFDKATQNPANPTIFLPAYDHGDHLHPNDPGYKAMGDAIDLKLFQSK